MKVFVAYEFWYVEHELLLDYAAWSYIPYIHMDFSFIDVYMNILLVFLRLAK